MKLDGVHMYMGRIMDYESCVDTLRGVVTLV